MESFKPKLPETPITNSLDPENKKWVEESITLTNDDNLREDYALEILKDPEFFDKLRAGQEQSIKTNEQINKTLWDMYEKQLQIGHYLEVQKDLKKKTGQLIDELKILKTRQDIEERFNLQKSDISKEEILKYKEEKIKDIENELFNISAQEVTRESSEKVLNEYSKIIEKYTHLYTMFRDEDFNPSLN